MLRPYGIDAHIGARIATRIAVRDDIPSPARHAGAPHRRYRGKLYVGNDDIIEEHDKRYAREHHARSRAPKGRLRRLRAGQFGRIDQAPGRAERPQRGLPLRGRGADRAAQAIAGVPRRPTAAGWPRAGRLVGGRGAALLRVPDAARGRRARGRRAAGAAVHHAPQRAGASQRPGRRAGAGRRPRRGHRPTPP